MELEDCDDDVDVLFEDSVLHQALLSCGVSEVETEIRSTMKEEMQGEVNDNGCATQNAEASVSKKSSNASTLARFALSSAFLNDVRDYHQYETLHSLISSKLLLAEDRAFLQDYIEVSPPAWKPSEGVSVWTRPMIGLFLVLTGLINATPLESYVCPQLETFGLKEIWDVPSIALSHILINVAWIILCLLVSCVCRRRLQAELVTLPQSRDVQMREMESKAWELIHLEKRCLRLLRESELVARGFTLATQQYAAGSGQGRRSTVDRLCPQLRSTMLRENRKLLATINSAVVTMMKRVPMLVSDSDFSTMDDFQEDDALFEEENKSGVLPMAPLSKSVNLLQIYVSGCVRRLALCFYQRNWKDPSVDPYKATQDSVASCTEAITTAHAAVQEQHSFYRAVHQSMVQGVEGDHSSLQTRGSGNNTELQNFYTCVNSLDLHLQSVLIMTRDLSSALEARLDEAARNDAGFDRPNNGACSDRVEHQLLAVSAEDRELWEEMLTSVKTSLDSVQCCYDEAVRKLCSKDDKGPTLGASEIQAPDNNRIDGQTKVKVIPAEDPVIEDQVFEGVTDPGVDDDEEDMEEWRRQRQQRKLDMAKAEERRNTMKMLKQELGAVVSHRAIAQREREERALGRARGEVLPSSGQATAGNHLAQNEDNKQTIDLLTQNKPYDALDKTDTVGIAESHDDKSQGLMSRHTDLDGDWPKKGQCKDGTMSDNINRDSDENRGVNKEDSNVGDDDDADKQGTSNIVKDKTQYRNRLHTDISENGKTVNGYQIKSGKCLRPNSAGDGSCIKGSPKEKVTLLDSMRNGLQAEPTELSDLDKQSTYLSGLSKTCLDHETVVNDTQSLGVNYFDDFDMIKPADVMSAPEDVDSGMLSSFLLKRKKFWKRPAPPRVGRRIGCHYVTPVNLVTVGVVLHGGGGCDSDGDRGNDRNDRSGRSRDQKGKEKDGGDGKRFVKKIQGQGNAVGPIDSEDQDGETRPQRPIHGRWSLFEVATGRQRSPEGVEMATLPRREGILEEGQGHIHVGQGRHNQRSKPAFVCYKVPVTVEQHGNRSPDSDLVGGLRLSPEETEEGAAETDLENVLERGAEGGVGPVPERGRTVSTRTTSGSSTMSVMKSQITVPRQVDPEVEGFHKVRGRYVSRHNFTASDRVSPEPRYRRRSRSNKRGRNDPDSTQDIQDGRSIEDSDADNADPSQTYATTSSTPRRAQHNVDDISNLSMTPPISFCPCINYSPTALGTPKDGSDPNEDQWVKITQQSLVWEDGSQVQLIREKELNMRSVLSQVVPPIPSPNHDSSFTRKLAQMAAEQAHRMLRSPNIGILGGEETYVNDDSSDEY